jgi:hypothetical protein
MKRVEIDVAVNAAVRALLFAAIGHGIDERHGPPLELIFVLRCQCPRALKVFRGAMNIEHDAGERVT